MIKKIKNKRRGTIQIKKCEYCNQEFEVYTIRVNSGGGKFCSRDCYQKNREITLEAKLEKHRLNQKKHKYNLEKEDYYSLIDNQDNKCGICKTIFKNTNRYDTPCVDHCHTTNKVRGLLCQSCNKGLGHFSDNIDILISAVEYLKINQ
jgi:hypothetical protein